MVKFLNWIKAVKFKSIWLTALSLIAVFTGTIGWDECLYINLGIWLGFAPYSKGKAKFDSWRGKK